MGLLRDGVCVRLLLVFPESSVAACYVSMHRVARRAALGDRMLDETMLLISKAYLLREFRIVKTVTILQHDMRGVVGLRSSAGRSRVNADAIRCGARLAEDLGNVWRFSLLAPASI
jgi:hypothetical protein